MERVNIMIGLGTDVFASELAADQRLDRDDTQPDRAWVRCDRRDDGRRGRSIQTVLPSAADA
jgi:hypothetical protein